MHELSLCHGIYGIVDRARENGRVRTIEVRIGHLRQVVPETLAYCWDLVTDESELAGSRLEIDHVPATVECRGCGHLTALVDLPMRCESCGSADTRVVSGEECSVISIELDDEEAV